MISLGCLLVLVCLCTTTNGSNSSYQAAFSSSCCRGGLSIGATTGTLRSNVLQRRTTTLLFDHNQQEEETTQTKKKSADNKATMAFLKKIGRVGGAANKNFINAVGADEGTVGKVAPASGNGMNVLKKARGAYKECTESGVIDDLSESFPLTSCGTEWRGISDRVMGGISNGILERKTIVTQQDGIDEHIVANVLEGNVSLENNGGFIQMAADLAPPSAATSSNTVDASNYKGIEVTALHNNNHGDLPANNKPETFNVHLRTPDCMRQPSSYRATFSLQKPGVWETIQIPFDKFIGHATLGDTPLDIQHLRRIGILAIGREIQHVSLAISNVSFF